ncbi:MAG: hypothetical protein CMB99_06545 [Flavobacteriaceae bacterium]|nr:hypothetical protein [Flavobacteriaceae bacterium]|tara:strand:- start:7663 stop:8292 length:630 start_codon:yes stop_codon:yes gene_type:complete
MSESKHVVIIGYSGHALVLIDIIKSMGFTVNSYCDNEEKSSNPFELDYLGSENSATALEEIRKTNFFVCIGSNVIRKAVQTKLFNLTHKIPINAIAKSSIIGSNVKFGNGVMVGDGVVINSQSKIGDGVVCNTNSTIEHEVIIDDFSFIGPNATLLGACRIGKNCFIGANAIILQGIEIGDNCVIGAGTVVLKDLPDNSKVVGNPSRFI